MLGFSMELQIDYGAPNVTQWLYMRLQIVYGPTSLNTEFYGATNVIQDSKINYIDYQLHSRVYYGAPN